MMKLERICNNLHGMKAAILMVVAQFLFAGNQVMFKLAANDGMNLRIIIAYRYLFASAFTAPIAIFLHRNRRVKISWSVLFYAFLCGLFGGALLQNLYIQSMVFTSAIFASAILNLVPAITFVLAVSFRMEKLNVRRVEGMAKVVGTLVGIGGAMLFTFYKGSQVNIWLTHIDLLNHDDGHVASSAEKPQNMVLGSLLAVGSCISFSLWLLAQAKLAKIYPCHYSSTALMCIMGALQAAIFSICVERDWSQWKLGWNIRLLTVAYSGILGSGVAVMLVSWCVHLKGPLYVSVFNPLMLVLVAIVGSFCLNENLYIGSVVGGVLIICGLYIVLWGKSKEREKITELTPCKSIKEPELINVEVMTSKHEKESEI